MFITIAAIFSFFRLPRESYLILRDDKTNRIFAAFPATEATKFSITFIHSVNKSPICDIYQIKDGAIYVIETHYSSFGAGVQTTLEPGQTLTYKTHGTMIVSGFNQRFERLSYIVGTVSDHVLRIDQKEISLRELCGRNSTVVFQFGHSRFLKYFLGGI